MRQVLALLTGDVDVADTLNLDELIDHRLQRRQISVQKDVHAGVGDGLRDVFAVGRVLRRQLGVYRVDAQDGRGQYDQSKEREDAKPGFLKKLLDFHCYESQLSQSSRVTKRPSCTTV